MNPGDVIKLNRYRLLSKIARYLSKVKALDVGTQTFPFEDLITAMATGLAEDKGKIAVGSCNIGTFGRLLSDCQIYIPDDERLQDSTIEEKKVKALVKK
jgi:hypothetical protein